ncbi:MAG: CCA tRNA nucleotidyltransferase [Parasphingorhabdus sp.]|uniref:CCA tRNA nucleotidyltransferase n=1 Tax=Parasphingorhabdus sp. TaxID=2709688 RepID=UPI0032985886
MKLPAAPWLQTPSLLHLVSVLDGEQDSVRLVGGVVRDTLLGRPVKDIDLATIFKPQEVMDRLKKADIKVIPTGVAHGTVTAVTEDGPVEITTLRRDVSTDGRRATIAFSDDWKEDAARRDFTINALFADLQTLEVYDYFDGLKDLEARRVRFIGSADKRIAEDHLRIMRYFRFLAGLGQHTVDQETFNACRKAAPYLDRLSRERIADELMKLLSADDPVYAVQEMIAADIFAHIVSAIDPQAGTLLAGLILREEANHIKPAPIRRLVGLLPKEPAETIAIAKSLRLSKKQQRAIQDRLVVAAQEGGFSPSQISALAYRHGTDAVRDILLLYADGTNLVSGLATLNAWVAPAFAITGGDLIALGLAPGPIVTQCLERVETQWIAEDFPDQERTRAIAQEIILQISAE